MKTAILISTLCAVFTACNTLPGIIWPTTVKCGGPIAGALVDDVSIILQQGGATGNLTDTAVKLIEELAQQYGASTVACVVNQLIGAWTSPMMLKADPDLVGAAYRAREFLQRESIYVETGHE